MSQVVHRVNLSAAAFPFLSEWQGQSIIVKGQDQNYVQTITSKEDLDKDIGIPQIYYCHNVLPIASGFQSIGYNSLIGSAGGAETKFTNAVLTLDANENKGYISITSDGRVFLYTTTLGAWSQVATVSIPAGAIITYAYINGITYFYVGGLGCYYYDFVLAAWTSVTLTGLTPTAVVGITSSNGYLIAWTANSIAWSSLVSPTDFTPSLVTGAGGGAVQGARGSITFIAPITNGCIVYTTQNAVAATYSGNARYPWNFRELVSTGGVSDPSKVAYDSDTGYHYSYTTSGLELVTLTQSQVVFPELTDFLAGSYFEDFDEVSLLFTHQTLTGTMKKAINRIADRYLVFSYGVNGFTHAIVYDMAMKRFGKLKVNHVDVFEFQIPVPQVIETPKNMFAFLQQDGTVLILDVSFTGVNSAGCMLLGKYQYVRNRTMQLDMVEIENVPIAANFSVYDMLSLDGKNMTPYMLPQVYISDKLRDFGARLTGTNHSILLIGSFSLASIELTFNIHGRR